MNRSAKRQSAFLVSVLAVSTACATPAATGGAASQPAPSTLPSNEGGARIEMPPSPLESATVLTFSPDGTLFIGDSGNGKIYAVKPTVESNPAAKAPYNLKNVDSKIAALLRTDVRSVRVRDMAIHPQTKEAYLAVARATGDRYISIIVVLNQTGTPRLLELPSSMAATQIPFSPASGFSFYDEVPSRDLSFTDLEHHKGKLYVAGLSNADFASSLWTLSVPFSGKASTTTVEIYHAVHNQQETRAPIRTMKIVPIDGEDYLVAAYTCTPLVLIPLKSLKDGAHVVGKTIGELGYGNTPSDILSFTGQDMKQNKFPVVFITNKNQAAQVIGLQAIEAAAQKDGLTTMAAIGQTVDLGASRVPMTGLLHVDDQDPFHIAALRRDAAEGDLEMVSYLKNVYFRLSDFQSEYEIPGYTFPKSQDGIRVFQNRMKRDEGHAKFVVE